MILVRLIISIAFCVATTSEIQVIAVPPPTEDLKDEYYTTVLKPNNDFLPQDEKDAQSIMDSDRKETTIAGILSYRDKTRRFAIQQRMLTKIDPISSWISALQSHTRYHWVSGNYWPQRTYNSTCTFMDLCFGLLEDENVVLAQYLNNFLDAQDETWIIIDMVLIKDMDAMIAAYNKHHSFKDKRKYQKQPFENMLRVWVRQNRDQIDTAEPNKDDVKKDADALKAEYDSGDWHEKCRDKLELILMKKSIKYARAVIAAFETAMGGKKLEDIINDSVNSSIKLNQDLADAYSSLACYIRDKYCYIADLLRKHSDGSDHWAAWIMCIAVLHPQEWPKVDQAFQKDPKDGSLSKFILQKLISDKVMAEMIAVIVDSKFKPTTFSATLDQGGSSPTPSPPLPPVPPTVPAPSPPSSPS